VCAKIGVDAKEFTLATVYAIILMPHSGVAINIVIAIQ